MLLKLTTECTLFKSNFVDIRTSLQFVGNLQKMNIKARLELRDVNDKEVSKWINAIVHVI